MTPETAQAIGYVCVTVLIVAGISLPLIPYFKKDKVESLFSADPDLIKASLAVDTDYAELGVVRPDSIDMVRAALRKAGVA